MIKHHVFESHHYVFLGGMLESNIKLFLRPHLTT
jgi:hypothetical protein